MKYHRKIPSAMARAVLGAVILLGSITVAPARAEHASFKDEVFPIIKKTALNAINRAARGSRKAVST